MLVKTTVLVSFLFVFGCVCLAQDFSYDAYTTRSEDGSNDIVQTVLVEGTTTSGCGPLYNCPSTHQPDIYNDVGGVGGDQEGPQYDMFDYISYQTTTTFAATPGQQYSWSTEGRVYCYGGAAYVLDTSLSSTVLAYTSIQHNYPSNPLPQKCWITKYFDAVQNQKAHKAEDVVYDNGNGSYGVSPGYGTAVTAMEAGTVVAAVSTAGPASPGYPQCVGTGAPGNYAKIKSDSDGYFTVYFHMTPSVSVGQHVNQGDTIGVLDNSGCQSGAHLHVARKDGNNNPVNFTIPCTNPLPYNTYDDGLVFDDVPDGT